MTVAARNPFSWVEIYVEDMDRAQKFYESVFQLQLQELPMPEGVGEMEMKSFPWVEGCNNISGALVKMQDSTIGPGGTLVYFECNDCAIEADRAEESGGKILQPKMSIGNYGYCAVIMDTEGNSIGLHSMQ